MFNIFRRSTEQDRQPSPAPRLNWLQMEALQGTLQFGDLCIHVCLHEAQGGKPSSDKDFVVVKVPSMVEKMAALTEVINPKNIFELGIFKGGSVVLYNEMFNPRKFVAVDISTNRLPNLDNYLRDKTNVSALFGVDQSDRKRLAGICAEEFGGQPLDLVIDDASHFNFETRESFRELFPRLRPGGIYVIEDWAWAHWPGDLWQRDGGGDFFRGREPMTNLILELVILAAAKPDWVSQVSIESATVCVTRGPGRIEPGFDPGKYCLNQGKPLPRFS